MAHNLNLKRLLILVVINKQKFWEPNWELFLRTIHLQCNPDVIAFSTIPSNCIRQIIFYPKSGSDKKLFNCCFCSRFICFQLIWRDFFEFRYFSTWFKSKFNQTEASHCHSSISSFFAKQFIHVIITGYQNYDSKFYILFTKMHFKLTAATKKLC